MMSLYTRKIGNSSYRIFQTSANRQISLGPVGHEDSEQIRKALEYVRDKRKLAVSHYDELEGLLLALLPKEERRRLQGQVRSPALEEKTRLALEEWKTSTPSLSQLKNLNVAGYGLTSEGYRICVSLVSIVGKVHLIDPALDMAMELTASLPPALTNVSSENEPLLSFKPVNEILRQADVIVFSPKLSGKPESFTEEVSSMISKIAPSIKQGSVFLFTPLSGVGDGSEFCELIEKKAHLKLEDFVYLYMPIANYLDVKGGPVGMSQYKTKVPILALLKMIDGREKLEELISAEMFYEQLEMTSIYRLAHTVDLFRRGERTTSLEEQFLALSGILYDGRVVARSNSNTRLVDNILHDFQTALGEYLIEKARQAERKSVPVPLPYDRYSMKPSARAFAGTIQSALRGTLASNELERTLIPADKSPPQLGALLRTTAT